MQRDQGMGMGIGGRGRTGLVALALAAMVAAACGGDDDDSSGVDGEKTLDQLSPDEATDLCEWGVSLLDDGAVTRFACYYAALVFSEDSAACEAAAQECIDEAEPVDPDDTECEFEDPPACASEVSVAEIEACGRDGVAILVDLAEDISCDSDPEEFDILTVEQPASCQAVEEKCPELFDDDDEEGEASAVGGRGRRGDAARAAIRWVRGARRAGAMSGVAGAGS